MSKLIISGKKSYTTRMFKHLKKEHPSTRHRMILRDKMLNVKMTESEAESVHYILKHPEVYEKQLGLTEQSKKNLNNVHVKIIRAR